MQLQLKYLKRPKKCKWVAVNLNTKFANIDLINEAISEAKEEEVCVKAKETKS